MGEKLQYILKEGFNLSKLFLLFSHELTGTQVKEAEEELGIENFIYLPKKLQHKWSEVPTEDLQEDYLKDIKNFVLNVSKVGDYVLVQGEYGITYKMVNWCLSKKLIPIYSATRREYSCVKKEDGSIENRHIFRHIRFKKYDV